MWQIGTEWSLAVAVVRWQRKVPSKRQVTCREGRFRHSRVPDICNVMYNDYSHARKRSQRTKSIFLLATRLMTNCLLEQELWPFVSCIPVLTDIFSATAKFSQMTSSLRAPLHDTSHVPPGNMLRRAAKFMKTEAVLLLPIPGVP